MKQLILIIVILITAVFASAQKQYDLVKDFGAKPDNRTDCYGAMQKAATVITKAGGGILNIPKGKYYIGKVKITGGKNANHIDNITFINCSRLIIKGNGSTIRVNGHFLRTEDFSLPGVSHRYSYEETVIPFYLQGCRHVLLQDLILDGGVRDMKKETINEGDCSGILIDDYGKKEYSSNDIIIKNVVSDYFATDGIMLRCRGSNILVSNCKAKFNGRQGVSIVAGQHIVIDKCEFDSTGFTGAYGAHAPGAGIDVECDDIRNLPIKDVLIKNCSMRGNIGFQIVTTVASQNIHIDSCFIADPTYGFSDGLNGVGMYSINSSLTNSVIFGTLQVDLALQDYTGTVAQQFTGNIIYSGMRAVVSSDFARPCNISNNIFVMLPDAVLHQYFPYIQNKNCSFNNNIIMMHDSKISRQRNEYAGLVELVREAQNNIWLLNTTPDAHKNAGKYFYKIAFDGSRSGTQYLPADVDGYAFGTSLASSIPAEALNRVKAYTLFTSYKQRYFDRNMLVQASAVKAYLAGKLK